MSETSYVCKMNADQIEQLRVRLEAQDWAIDTIPYTHFRAQRNKTTVAAYTSGKVTVQGRGTPELVQFVIEPEILHEVRFGYEEVMAKEEHPEMFEPHAGIDESGKGDFFGPLVIACVYVDEHSAETLLKEGVQDSKAIKSDRRINTLAAAIRKSVRGKFAIVRIGPAAYNRLFTKMGNVNGMLGWGHARALEDLLEKQPGCPRAVADQFGRKSIVQNALKEKGRRIELEQRTKAESDIAVAAASILARQVFIEQLDKLGERAGVTLPRGANPQVIAAAAAIINRHGEDALTEYAKVHFRTAAQARAIANGESMPSESASDADLEP